MTDFDGYIRVSRVGGREGPGYISPAVQRDAIERWAQYQGVKIIAWHVDEDQSGGTQQRPGLRAAISRIESGETGGLVCWKLNRFARNVSGAISDIKRIEKAGGQLVLVEEGIDGRGPFGAFLLTILLAVATLERDNLTEGFHEAKKRAVGRGAVIGPTPLGYLRTPDGRLEPDPVFGPVIHQAYVLAATRGLGDAAEHLRAHGPNRRWNMATARRLLASTVYLGDSRYGNLVQHDAHEPLISRVTWEAAQSAPAARAPSVASPLLGLLFCATCGSKMIGGRGGRDRARTYRCYLTTSQQMRKGEHCDRGAAVTAKVAERFVAEQVQALTAGYHAVVEDGGDLGRLEDAVADAERELEEFALDLTARRLLGAGYHAALQARADAVEAARVEFRARAASSSRISLSGVDLSRPEMLVPALRGVYRFIVYPGHLPAAEKIRMVAFDADNLSGELPA